MVRNVIKISDTANELYGVGIGLTGSKAGKYKYRTRIEKKRAEANEVLGFRSADNFATAVADSGKVVELFSKLLSDFSRVQLAQTAIAHKHTAPINLKDAANSNDPVSGKLLRASYENASGAKSLEDTVMFEAHVPKQTSEKLGLKGSYIPFTEAAAKHLYTIEETPAAIRAHTITAPIPKAPQFNLAA